MSTEAMQILLSCATPRRRSPAPQATNRLLMDQNSALAHSVRVGKIPRSVATATLIQYTKVEGVKRYLENLVLAKCRGGERTAIVPVLQAPRWLYKCHARMQNIDSPAYSSTMVRLSTVLGFALATASVFIPGVLSQDVPACGDPCAQQALSTSGCNA